MSVLRSSAPAPELRVVRVDKLLPHEDHDHQRSLPLMEQLQTTEVFINPPIVTPIEGGDAYLVLDGANRCHSFKQLNYRDILVQVTSYNSGYVELDTWKHVVSEWQIDAFIEHLEQFDDLQLMWGNSYNRPIATINFPDERELSLYTSYSDIVKRNALLRSVVRLYGQHARLNRTAIHEVHQIWPLYPDAIALVTFPQYQPDDIVEAAKSRAFLPSGVSRHIIHGRALQVNYPMQLLRDEEASIREKNEALQFWLQTRLANRQVRYYSEATYVFGE